MVQTIDGETVLSGQYKEYKGRKLLIVYFVIFMVK